MPCSSATIRVGPDEGYFSRTCTCGKPFGAGIGQSLLARVARIAMEEGCYGIQWEVLDWNEPAIELYKNLGVEFRDQWRPVLLTGPSLKRLGEKVS